MIPCMIYSLLGTGISTNTAVLRLFLGYVGIYDRGRVKLYALNKLLILKKSKTYWRGQEGQKVVITAKRKIRTVPKMKILGPFLLTSI